MHSVISCFMRFHVILRLGYTFKRTRGAAIDVRRVRWALKFEQIATISPISSAPDECIYVYMLGDLCGVSADDLSHEGDTLYHGCLSKKKSVLFNLETRRARLQNENFAQFRKRAVLHWTCLYTPGFWVCKRLCCTATKKLTRTHNTSSDRLWRRPRPIPKRL